MKAEYPEVWSCPQKDSAEHEEYAGAHCPYKCLIARPFPLHNPLKTTG